MISLRPGVNLGPGSSRVAQVGGRLFVQLMLDVLVLEMSKSKPIRHVISLSRLLLIGAVCLGSVVGCSGGAAAQSESSPPDWYLNPDEAYSEQRYLTAVASGATSQEAQNKAFGNLARVFEADIQASQDLRDDYREVQQGGEVTESQKETRLITRSDVQSNQKLLNSDVFEQGQRGDTHYAMVGMERQETLSIYSDEIESNRSLIADYRERAQASDNPITRLAFLQKALVLAKVNDRLITQRNIIAEGAGARMAEGSPIAELEEAVRTAQSNCPVVVRADTDDIPSSIVDQVGATLETAGFRVIKQPDTAILDALVKYQERPALESRDMEFLRWTLAIELTEQTSGQTLETFTTERRAGGNSKAGVERRAHNKARSAIKDEFSTFLEQTLLDINP